MCGVSICPVHTRTTVVDPIEPNVPARAITYIGEYCVATLDNPEFGDPASLLAALFGQELEPKDMFMHLVVKVGDKALSDVMDAGKLESSTVFRETFLSPADGRLEAAINPSDPFEDTSEFNRVLSEIFIESHELVLASVKSGVVA